MTADEIRNELRANIREFNGSRPDPESLVILLYGMAGEIAAQLAELNEQIGKGRFSPVLVRGARRRGSDQ